MRTLQPVVAILLMLCLHSALAQEQIWEHTNGPYGGTVRSMAVHPSGDLFVGMYDGGLLRSTNGGDFWFRVGFAGHRVGQLLASSSGNIFLGVSHSHVLNEWDHASYRSTDGGVTWQQMDISMNVESWASDDSGNHYVACWTPQGPNGNFTIFKSTNEGETWAVWSYYSGGNPNGLLFWNSHIFMSDVANGIKRLVNNTWVRAWPTGGPGTGCIVVTQGGVLLAGVRNPPQGVYRSIDTASTWQRVYGSGMEGARVGSLVINSAGIVFAGTSNGVFRSTDEGATWEYAGLQNTSLSTLVLADTVTLFAGDSFGVHRCRGSEPWKEVDSGLYVGRTVSMAVNRSSHAYFAATNAGLFRSANAGNEWDAVLPWSSTLEVLPPGIVGIPLLVDANFNLYTKKGDLYRSSDDGVTWITSQLSSIELRCLEDGRERGVLFGGGKSYDPWPTHSMVFRSTDSGLTWSQTSFDWNVGSVQCLAMSGTSSNLFTGAVGGGLHRSTDQGLNWRSFNIGLTNTEVYSMIISSEGHVFLGTSAGVFRSRDEGGNWRLVGLANDTVLALAVNSIGHILAGTSGGHVFKSSNDGSTWTDFSSGLRGTAVRSLVVDEQGFAMVGTVWEGVFRTIRSTVDVSEGHNEVPSTFHLFQNYPNPFNPSTTIRYGLPLSSFVTLAVYNTLGQQVAQLVHERQQAGYHDVVFRGDGLASGVYFYRIQAGDFVASKKLLMLK